MAVIRSPTRRHASSAEAIAEAAVRVDIRRAAVIGARAVLVLWLVGVAHAVGLVSLPLLNLDREGTIPTAFSGALLLWAATAAFVAAARGAPKPRSLRVVGVVLAFMALDEVLRLHEAIDSAVNFDWQVLFLPLVVVAVVGWAGVLRSIRNTTARAAWIGGAACWAVSQVLEVWEWDGRVRPGSIDGGQSFSEVERKLGEPAYLAKMLPEELLELSGSLLFSLVLLYLAREAASAQPGRASRQARPTEAVG